MLSTEPRVAFGIAALAPRPRGYERRAVLVIGSPALADQLSLLRSDGYPVEIGEAAAGADRTTRAIAVLDVSESGYEPSTLAARIRALPASQVVVLTGAGAEARIAAFEAGADLVLSTPIDAGELLARVRAALRRAQSNALRVAGDLRLDREQRTVCGPHGRIAVRTREFDLLWAMAGRPNAVFTRSHLATTVWSDGIYAGSRTIDVHVGQLRTKLAAAGVTQARLVTIWSVGYRLEVDPA